MKKQTIFSIFLILLVVSMFESVSAREKGGGGAVVPITTMSLTEQGTDYNMKPGRLKFEFDEKLYGIQVRRVKEEYTDFLIMTLDRNKQDDITAYTLDNSFSLNPEEKREIDLDKDGINDILIELREIISTGKYNSVQSADFSIKKINVKESEVILTNLTNVGESTETSTGRITGSEIQEPISESVIVNQETKEPTFLENIINWFKGMFGIKE